MGLEPATTQSTVANKHVILSSYLGKNYFLQIFYNDMSLANDMLLKQPENQLDFMSTLHWRLETSLDLFLRRIFDKQQNYAQFLYTSWQ